MKKIMAVIFAAGSFTMISAQSLTVNFGNLATSKGYLDIGVFNKKENFLKDGYQFLRKRIKVSGSSASYTFTNLPKGEYAVAAYQDENSNNKCDRNFMGIPTEGYGFSNNVRPKIAPPSFTQTKVLVDDKKTITISMIH